MTDRTSLRGKLTKAITNPGRLMPHVRRVARNARIKASTRTHTEFYAQVVADDAARNPDRAIGSNSRDSWLEIGAKQHDYLIRHGMKADSRILDIGCGNLRAGWRIARTVDRGNYYGVDITPAILIAAQDKIREYEIQDRMPYLAPIANLQFGWLPNSYFDIVTAHSVFSHTRYDVIEEALDNVPRLLKAGGFFDFTYFESSDDQVHVFADEDFYYPTQMLIAAAEERGLSALVMRDWGPYIQAKLRIQIA